MKRKIRHKRLTLETKARCKRLEPYTIRVLAAIAKVADNEKLNGAWISVESSIGHFFIIKVLNKEDVLQSEQYTEAEVEQAKADVGELLGIKIDPETHYLLDIAELLEGKENG